MSHSVRSHLRIETGAYDEVIRTFLPEYDEMLSLAVLEECRHCQVTLIDVDPEMLDQARERLVSYSSRISFLRQSFRETLPDCDAVVASLALHHVPSISEKEKLYGTIHTALRPGGVFVNADVTMPAEPDARKADYATWAAHLVASGIPQDRAWEHFEEWAAEDFYFPLEEELSTLEEAGLASECLWRITPSTVIKGVKSTTDLA